jgi:murein DD-endopeptidase MepM/ murein hydrolase activator NlpD
MQLKLKYLILIFFIFLGFFLFIFNINKLILETKNNLFLKKIDKKQIVKSDEKFILSKKPEVNILSDKTSDNNLDEYKKVFVKVKKGQTFSEILDNFKIKNKKKFKIINSINNIYNLKSLDINQEIIFFIDSSELVKKIIIELDFKTILIVNLTPIINSEKIKLKTYTNIESKEFYINNSLYSDGISNKIPNEILIKLIQLFSFDLDFQRDIKKNTQVSISYQKINVEDKSDFSFGDIQYARITINKNNLEYFKFFTNDGFFDYFNRDGKNVKKSILKTPLDGAKLSSNFGMRKHPISGFNKMHKGIDFAAPKGTPIYAGGNGVIEVARVNGGYGKYIRIRHNNDYKTAYAHLSNFRKGISKGIRVNQGEIIGYVGSTGKSTGPHLHYEIIYKNKQINPLTLKLPSGKILEGVELEKFKKNYKTLLANHLNNLFE